MGELAKVDGGRQRRFYAWGYTDEDVAADDVARVAAMFAKRFGVSGFEATPPPKVEEFNVRRARLEPPASLAAICSGDPQDRLAHTYGKSWLDSARMFERDCRNPPDLVAYPRDEQQVVDLLDWCARSNAIAIPFGGGSSVVSGFEPPAGDRAVLTIDLGNLNRVLDVDKTSEAARIQGGVLGPHLEAQLKPHGLTLRHYTQSFEISSLGGWIATRAGGHFATLYTHIDDLVESLRTVTPAGVLESRRLPGSGAGPSPDRMIIGSEGILGIVTEAWMRLRKRPTFRATTTVWFKDFLAGAEAVRALSQSGLYPANCRLLEAQEAADSPDSPAEGAVVVLSFESADHPLDAWMQRALELCADHGGKYDKQALAQPGAQREGAAGEWRTKFIRMPYYQEHLTARGIIATTCESAITWDRFPEFREQVMRRTMEAAKRIFPKHPSTFTCRFTHVYPDGPAPYFTFHALADKSKMIGQYSELKHEMLGALIDGGGTITHHHAVGRYHRPWYDRQRPELFARALRAAKKALDPTGMMNPGVLIDP